MSAEYLRETARMMRGRAQDATSGPWSRAGVEGMGFAVHRGEHDTVALHASGPDARHIAAWHPGVALAVADWLDVTAGHLASHDCEAHCEPEGCPESHAAHAVARAWRGDT